MSDGSPATAIAVVRDLQAQAAALAQGLAEDRPLAECQEQADALATAIAEAEPAAALATVAPEEAEALLQAWQEFGRQHEALMVAMRARMVRERDRSASDHRRFEAVRAYGSTTTAEPRYHDRRG